MFCHVTSTELSELVADIMNRKGLALMQSQNLSEAAAAFDATVVRYATANAKSVVEKVTNALLSKAAALLVQGKNLPEGDSPCCLAVWPKRANSAQVSSRL